MPCCHHRYRLAEGNEGAFAIDVAGIAFGNSGVHVPHGMSVVVNAPSVFTFTACACPDRHIAAAGWLGADTRGATDEDAGEVVAKQLIAMRKARRSRHGCDPGPAFPVAEPGRRHIQSPLASGCGRWRTHPDSRADPSATEAREPGGTCR